VKKYALVVLLVLAVLLAVGCTAREVTYTSKVPEIEYANDNDQNSEPVDPPVENDQDNDPGDPPNENDQDNDPAVIVIDPVLAQAIALISNDDTWYDALVWHDKESLHLPYGSPREIRHGMELWKLFREDPALFWAAVSAVGATESITYYLNIYYFGGPILGTVIWQLRDTLVSARIADPALYTEAAEAIQQARMAYDCETIAVFIDVLQSHVQLRYEQVRAWRIGYMADFILPDWMMVERMYYARDLSLLSGGALIDIMHTRIYFGHDGDELGALHIMYNMLYGTHGWHIMSLGEFLVYLEEDWHDRVTAAVARRVEVNE